MTKPHSGLAVVETRWEGMDISVRPLVEIACGTLDKGPLAFEYEMTNSRIAFQDAIFRLSRNRQIRHVYIACHGTRRGLVCFNGDKIKIDELVELFGSTSFEGVHFGVCEIGSEKNLRTLLAGTRLGWCSGYSQWVDWAGSAALDLQFIHNLVANTRRKRQRTIGDVAQALKHQAAGACTDFGLSILSRDVPREIPTNLMDLS
ncbi:hypothetical protein NKJ70_05850 [Mesorhizobium sp. M0092]|uniref:hypothetical protein n=1 Tax=Mesorhizobium sp. M0092 TaxID=2956876 RepID=UPI00333A38FE